MASNAHEAIIESMDAAWDAAVDENGEWRPAAISLERWAQMCPDGDECRFGDGEGHHWHPGGGRG